MSELPQALPRPLLFGLICAAIAVAGAAGLVRMGRGTLRQGRLLALATERCEQSRAEAEAWLARDPQRQDGIAEARRALQDMGGGLLRPDRGRATMDTLRDAALQAGFAVDEASLGTPRSGEALDTVSARLVVEGDRVELPPLLERIYAGPLLVRLITLDVEVRRFGARQIRASVSWDHPARPRATPARPTATDRWAPPAAANPEHEAVISGPNQGRWDDLRAAVDRLTALAEPLRRAAADQGTLEDLRAQNRALERWISAGEAEHRAVLRKLPALLEALDGSATGVAHLRPGPGGGLRVEAP